MNSNEPDVRKKAYKEQDPAANEQVIEEEKK